MRKSMLVVAVVFAVAVFALGANQALAHGGYHHGHHYGGRYYPRFYGSWYAAPSVAVVPAYPVSPPIVIPGPVVVRPRCYR
jgi:hypothetical protein